MQFDTYIYALFLPIVFALYWALRKKLFWQNVMLLIASYIFYGWWDWRFLGLIAITSASTFLTGLAIKPDHSRKSKAYVAFNIVLNIGILATFKYFNFFRDTFADLLRALGANPDFPTIYVLLPVGISFYTLQAISYTLDLYRGKVKHTRNAVAFFVYIAFFPQLVAGPIERASNLLPQFLREKKFDYYNAVIGMRQILWGLLKKLVIADNLAGFVQNILYNPLQVSPTSILMAVMIFSVQIYADFSGYSDIAIGSARLFNIKLLPNFRYPFFSRSFRELWQRWHISLMTWFREYLYFPLGGSRCSKWRICFNIMTVFTISGLWHGAKWNYVLWGAFSGLILLPSVFMPKKKYSTNHASWKDLHKCFFTFFLFAVTLIVFRTANLSHMLESFTVLFTGNYLTIPIGISALYYIVPFMVVEWLGRKQEFPIMKLPMPTIARWAIYWAILYLIAFYSASANIQYIYFQF